MTALTEKDTIIGNFEKWILTYSWHINFSEQLRKQQQKRKSDDEENQNDGKKLRLDLENQNAILLKQEKEIENMKNLAHEILMIQRSVL